MNVSLIITTYNRPAALKSVLTSVADQSVLPAQLIIADDGSKEDTQLMISSHPIKELLPVEHIWQADEGFRLARVRNLAISKAKSDYIIFIDGDMVLHRHFIQSHITHSAQGYFLQGSRVILSARTTSLMISNQMRKPTLFSKGVRNRHHMLHVPVLAKWFSRPSIRWDTVRGCNMSFWMEDLIKVNGFDEQYMGWGREDNDLAIRVLRLGVQRKNIKFCAVAYHLYHRENKRDETLNRNDELLRLVQTTTRIKSLKGLDRHL